MADAYRALDLVAFPTSSEGFGRVVIEAGAVGRPVVATNLPVLRELMPPDFAK
jgi:glycosyltransferase involved in cell wall biosynthesis